MMYLPKKVITGGGGSYTPDLVENDNGNAYYTKSANFAPDNAKLWGAMIFQSPNDGSTEKWWDADRAEAYRVTTNIRLQFKKPGATILDTYIGPIAANAETHVAWYFDGDTPDFQAWIDGSEITPSNSTGPSLGSIDLTRGTSVFFNGTDFDKLGDFFVGTGVFPGISNFHDGVNYVDPSSVSATFKQRGPASTWNGSPPSGYTLVGTFGDA